MKSEVVSKLAETAHQSITGAVGLLQSPVNDATPRPPTAITLRPAVNRPCCITFSEILPVGLSLRDFCLNVHHLPVIAAHTSSFANELLLISIRHFSSLMCTYFLSGSTEHFVYRHSCVLDQTCAVYNLFSQDESLASTMVPKLSTCTVKA